MTGEATRQCNIDNGAIAVFQEMLSAFYSLLNDVLMGRDSRGLLKHAPEMERTHIQYFCQIRQLDFLG